MCKRTHTHTCSLPPNSLNRVATVVISCHACDDSEDTPADLSLKRGSNSSCTSSVDVTLSTFCTNLIKVLCYGTMERKHQYQNWTPWNGNRSIYIGIEGLTARGESWMLQSSWNFLDRSAGRSSPFYNTHCIWSFFPFCYCQRTSIESEVLSLATP